MPVLTADQRTSWTERGFVRIGGFADPSVGAAMLARVTEVVRDPALAEDIGVKILPESNKADIAPEQPEDGVSKIFRLHRDPVFTRFAHSADVVDVVAELISPDIDVFLSQFIFKTPGAWGQPWHQDSFYFPFEPARPVVGIWLAVTRATLVNGCLHVLPGSQTEPVHTHVPDRRPGANFGYFEIVDHDMGASEPVLMDPGDLLVFDSHLMHCSTDNDSDGIRAAMVYHYAAAGTVDHSEEYFPSTNDWVAVRRGGAPCRWRRRERRDTTDASKRADGPMALKFDAMVPAQPLRQAADLGRRAAAAGLSGLVVTEAGRTAYLTCGALATAADIDILTGIAVAFPRSPMVTASTAWELAEASGGRFRLGLGSQVRAHIERRYGSAFEHPGPRLREYVLAVKAIFASFRHGAPLAVEGEFYNLSLLPPTWAPGPIACDDPPVDVAAVSPWMLRMAAEVADGVHVHPLNTPTYLRETVLPNLETGAKRSGRGVEDLEVIVPAFLVVGDTEEERGRWRELARVQVAFYGSTPNYAFIFDQLDREGTTDLIRERQRAGDIPGMAAVIDDELLEHFVTEGTWDDIADTIVAKYGGVATRVVSYFTGSDVVRRPDAFERWGALAHKVRSLS